MIDLHAERPAEAARDTVGAQDVLLSAQFVTLSLFDKQHCQYSKNNTTNTVKRAAEAARDTVGVLVQAVEHAVLEPGGLALVFLDGGFLCCL